MTAPDVSAASRYCDCMEDIKTRLGLIKNIVAGHSPLGSEGLDGEVVCLQLRRILEQIAFGSLLAHRDTYETAHNDLERVWRAKGLLERLGKIHSEFYPIPVAETRHRPMGVRNFEPLKEGFLTVEEFTFLYDTASGGIHTWNPFKQAERILNFEKSIAEWVQRIERLLALHLVRFANTQDVWLVQMDHPEDHKVHAFTAPAIDMEGAPATPEVQSTEPMLIVNEPDYRVSLSYSLPVQSISSTASIESLAQID